MIEDLPCTVLYIFSYPVTLQVFLLQFYRKGKRVTPEVIHLPKFSKLLSVLLTCKIDESIKKK